MKVTCSSETSVDFQQATQHYIPEGRTPHNHCSENLKLYKIEQIEDKVMWASYVWTAGRFPLEWKNKGIKEVTIVGEQGRGEETKRGKI
jgi:hypothetical protein